MNLEDCAGEALEITRVFDAPRELVFRSWTDPEMAKRWWGCPGCRASFTVMDARPGGAWRACLSCDDGRELWLRGVFREVASPDRLVFTFAWEQDDERGLGTDETIVTVTFVSQGGKTLMRFRQAPFATTARRDSHQTGWASGFNRLEELFAESETNPR